ncbi:MAG: cell division protein FtsZ, partial [Hyphomicrobiales bacterium]|nr:cell division protein FtsZ [Hyphomicrobiales bacterium]
IIDLQKHVDTLLIIPNQNLFRVANEKTTFADAFAMADQVLYSGVACITDLMVKEGLINLDFADVRAVMREMGKAMMGTGEASGDKRALQAAEAAISNPLIDETSMKGAKGLLISITGGKDLLLYEVDEAATRIREEVDGDANIIVGATFDESLDGIVRVSVVATGIDIATSSRQPAPQQVARPAQPAPQPTVQSAVAAARLAELTQNLRANPPQRPVDRSEQAHRAVAQALAVPPAVQAEASASEASGDAPATFEDVTIRPIASKPSLFLEAVEDQTPSLRPPAPALEKPFIPPQPERAPQRAVRMPQIDEFPPQAQKQIEAHRGEAEEGGNPEKQRLSLLQRLASVGLGRRSDDAPAQQREPVREAPRPAAVRQAPPMPKAPPMPPMPRPDPVSDYAKRPAPRPSPQGLDIHGRPAPVHNSAEDDQLEIPAFLRRQAN